MDERSSYCGENGTRHWLNGDIFDYQTCWGGYRAVKISADFVFFILLHGNHACLFNYFSLQEEEEKIDYFGMNLYQVPVTVTHLILFL